MTASEGAQVTVRNDGPGDAGNLTVNADTIYLQDNAKITSSTRQGNGGDVLLNLRSALLLRERSGLSSEAGGSGDGGNLTLNAPVIAALENSDIIANAFRGSGGEIQINTQLLLGTQFRDQLTDESDITASSEFGLNGVVTIDLPEIDPRSETVALPQDTADPDYQIAAGCSAPTGAFIASGRGGLPINPTTQLSSNRLWHDLREITTPGAGGTTLLLKSPQIEATAQLSNTVVIEATAFTRNEQGEAILTASENGLRRLASSDATCLRESV